MFNEHDQTESTDRTEHSHSHQPEALGPDAPKSETGEASISLLDRMEHELQALRSLASEQASHSSELETRQQDLERKENELAERDRLSTQRETELEEAQNRLIEDRERAAAEVQRAEERAREITQTEQGLVEREQAIQQRTSELDAKTAEIERLREANELRTTEIEARECSLTSEHDEVSHLRSEVDGLREELSRTRAKLAEAGRHLSEQKHIVQSPDAGNDTPDAFNETRRARLVRYKQLLRSRAQKVAEVKETLKRRQKELQKAQEQIGAKQKELQKARDTRDQAERMMLEAQEKSAAAAKMTRRAELRATKGKASVFVAGVLVSLVIACAASWFGVDRFAPATYLASARLEIDKRDADPTPEQIESWREFVVALPSDPQFLERGAQRLRVRGFQEMGSPTDLRRALEQRLEITSDNPNEVNLALQGQGSGPTERALETLATSVVAYANDTRQLRLDQSSTRLASRATAEGAPIDDQRLTVFAIAAGAASGLVLILTLIAWRLLRASVMRAGSDDNDLDTASLDALDGTHQIA